MKVDQTQAHWTDDELLGRLYGLSGGRAGCACPECEARYQALVGRRSQMLGSPVVPAERLRSQRASIWQRIEQDRRGMLWRALPAAATALMLVVGVALHQPAPRVQPVATTATAAAISDEQLLTEVASLISEESPRATDPMRALFTEASRTEAR
jgi:hypothetical protein